MTNFFANTHEIPLTENNKCIYQATEIILHTQTKLLKITIYLNLDINSPKHNIKHNIHKHSHINKTTIKPIKIVYKHIFIDVRCIYIYINIYMLRFENKQK